MNEGAADAIDMLLVTRSDDLALEGVARHAYISAHPAQNTFGK
jgi:hypothetical protein